LIPFGAFSYEFRLNPELFFTLFLAPLVFYTSMTANKKTLWDLKIPIVFTAVLLVMITAVFLGYLFHSVVPIIPMAVCFALVSALGPTDIVAVNAVEKRVKIPEKIMGILSGESIINDATGIVCFQFSIAAVTVGSFSLISAAEQFLLLYLGGVILGLILTGGKYLLVQWLLSHGIENNTLHILISVLTPFIFYMIAETLHVSGILCVFAAGIAHSFRSDKLNPEKVNLNLAQESVWSMMSFTLDGLVFVILGTQLPGFLRTAGSELPLGDIQIVMCIIGLMLAVLVFRFIWWSLTVQKKIYHDEDEPIGKIKSGIIFSLAGARGTVTMATVMSIPMTLAGGNAFPHRSLIIIIASGVIVVSLLITNFILPFFTERKTKESFNEVEGEAYEEIIQGVINRLTAETMDEKRMATERVIRSYSQRKRNTQIKGIMLETDEERELLMHTFLWEKENTLNMLKYGLVEEPIATSYIDILDNRLQKLPHSRSQNTNRRYRWFIRNLLKFRQHREERENMEDYNKLNEANAKYVLNKIENVRSDNNSPAVDRVKSLYELTASVRRGTETDVDSGRPGQSALDSVAVQEVALKGFSIERELIQEKYEEGRISWESAKEMRSNIAILEARLQSE